MRMNESGGRGGCDGAAGGSPGLLINELVGCSPRLASDSHSPQSSSICLSHTPTHTQIICDGFFNIASFHTSPYVAHTHKHACTIMKTTWVNFITNRSRRWEWVKKHTNSIRLVSFKMKCSYFSPFPVFPCVPEKPGMPCPGEDSKLNHFLFSFYLICQPESQRNLYFIYILNLRHLTAIVFFSTSTA